MKILVVFGSKSDDNVSSPLVESLSQHFDVEFCVLSAHRDLEALRDKINSWQGDAIIAGAGLAAALPGVVAAMSTAPVFGVPVPAQFAGLDAFASMAQMPPGTPVLSCGPHNTQAIVQFLTQCAKGKFEKLHIVAPDDKIAAAPELKAEIEKVKDTDITVSTTADARRFNLFLVTKDEDIKADAFGIHVPYLSKQDAAKPENYAKLVAWAEKGGIWVGVNNLRNAAAGVKRFLANKAALPPVLYQGSVKNVRGVAGKSPYTFEFSDRYSIFDWGQMPDALEGKGETLAYMAWFFFDFLGNPDNWKNWKAPAAFENSALLQDLRKQGMKHHALKLTGVPRCLEVEPVAVLHPACHSENGKLVWDYSAYQAKLQKTLVPLEVIFRFGVPEGSSLLQRASDAAYCKSIGLDTPPKAGDVFDVPVIEFSTKLETSDRYMPYSEAQEIAGLTNEEFKRLHALCQLSALRLKDCFAAIGTELWDGKLEFAFSAIQNGARDFMLVDSIGPDELRIIKDGVHLSKEALRSFYRPTAWHGAIETAKKLAKERGDKDWKRICTKELDQTPSQLPLPVRHQAEMIYQSIAHALSDKFPGKHHFEKGWSIEDVVKSFQQLKKDAA